MWSLSVDRSFAFLIVALLGLAGPVAGLPVDLDDAEAQGAGPAPAGDPTTGDGPPQDSSLLPGVLNTHEVVTDPVDDSSLFRGDQDPAPQSEFREPVDILSLSLGETDTAFLFSLKHKAYPDMQATLSSHTIMEAYCTMAWRVNEDEATRWVLSVNYLMPLQDDGYDTYASVYRETGENESFDRSRFGGIESALVGGDHLEMVLPKGLVTVGRDERTLQTGDRLTGFEISCFRNSGTFFLRYQDRAEADPKDAYAVTLAPRTTEIELAFPEDTSRSIAVPVGKTTKVSLDVHSLVDRKLLVNLTAAVVDGEGKPVNGWKVTTAPTLELKSEGTMPVSIIVSVEDGVQHRSGGILKVVAFPLGFDDKATFTAQAYATVPPSPEQNTLYFHRGSTSGWWCTWICIGTAGTGDAVSDPAPDVFYLNVLEEDPEFPATDGEDDGIALMSTDRTYAYLDTPLGATLRFDPEGFIDVAFSLRSGVARTVNMEAYVWGPEETLAVLNQRIDLTEDFQQHTFSAPLHSELYELPRDSYIGISIGFTEETLPWLNPTYDTYVSSIEWRPSESSLTLPLIERPETKVNITDGRALPSIVLGNRTDRQEYVNPGKIQAFDLLLINEGTERDVVRLTTTSSQSGWKFQFDPGNQFKLEPGTSAPLCVAVTAPEDAKEGDVVNISLVATSKLDEAVKTEIDLSLIVTTGVELVSETCRELDEDEYVAPLTDTEDSPLSSPLALLALLGIGVATARRRGP